MPRPADPLPPQTEDIFDDIIIFLNFWLDVLVNNLLDFVGQFLTDVINWFTGFVADAINWLAGLFESMWLWMQELVLSLKQFIADIVQEVLEIIRPILETLIQVANDVVTSIRDFIGNLVSEFRILVSQALQAFINWIGALFQPVVAFVNNAIFELAQFALQIAADIEVFFEDLLNFASNGLDELVAQAKAAFDLLFEGAESIIAGVEGRLSNLKEAFGEAALEIVQSIGGVAEDALTPIKDDIKGIFKALADFAVPEELERMIAEVQKLTGGQATAAEWRAFATFGWRNVMPDSPIYKAIFIAAMTAAAIIPVVGGVAAGVAQPILQEFARELPFTLLSPPDVLAAWRRGLITREVAIDTLRRQGLPETEAGFALENSSQVPPPVDLFAMWHREIVDDDPLHKALFQHGFDPKWQDRLKQVSHILPPIQDLIVMAVREAFSPAIVERFGQLEDFPPDFEVEAKKQGLDREWALKYWAAHWSLPSPQQGFEMLHRGIIDDDTLKLLLRALDVMPFWRDQLIQVAFNPFTRVDIRRMHRVEVLDRPGVKRAYLDLGYNPEKAEMLTEFTERLNEPPSAEDDEELGRLSRASIIGFYIDGLLTRPRAIELLVDLGHTPQAAGLYIDAEDFASQRQERSEAARIVFELVLARALTPEEAGVRLQSLGLEPLEVQRWLIKIERENQRRTKLPSRTEVEKMVKAGLVPISRYRDVLEAQGYAEHWIVAFMALLEGESG